MVIGSNLNNSMLVNDYSKEPIKNIVENEENQLIIRDKFEISNESKVERDNQKIEFNINEKRVEELKMKIKNGFYSLDSQKIAESIFKHIKEDRV